MTSENGLETVDRKSKINSDGSYDYGCFQVNNLAHPGFFKTQNWANATQNAAYAYTIYKNRNNFSAWYAVCEHKTLRPLKPGIWCK